MNFRQTKYVIGAGLIVLGIGIVVSSTLPKSFQYYVTVDELRAEESKLKGKELKVAGKVAVGSFQQKEGQPDYKFLVENGGKEIHVAYKGALPDTFKEGVEVVVTGRLLADGSVEASNVLAKCASRYQEKLTPEYKTPGR